ncbi:MAG TPA: HlyD family efflux transporter periplasmic adaptor subunit [Polyangia bacterium]|nr:HlyD family efflux transporter periplasmic adaptor subunit [Polyangia bacterium]
MSTPRIRTDLKATPAEEGGIKYFDVSDPKSGSHMRMYDFEWLIAERMDGRRPFDEVASWARERLGIAPSASDLEEYARKLRELGFFDATEEEPARAAPNAPTMMREAPTIPSPPPSSGNGAGKAGHADEDDDLPLVAEAPPIGADDSPRVVARNHTPHATAPTMAMPVTSERPVVAPPTAPPSAKTPAPATQPAGPPPSARASEPPARSSAGSIIGIVLVLAAVGGIVAYVKLMGGGGTAKVTTVMANPREIVRLYDGAATVKKSEGTTLSFGEAGKVSDVVAQGTEAKAGMPLATLDSYAKVEKDLADVKDRAGYYEKQLAAAKAKNDAEGVKADEAKVAEKKKLLTELEARAGKVRLVAPGAGTVVQVMVTAGADAKPGAPVVRIADKRSLAEFKLAAADAATMKPGAAVTLQPAGGGAPIAGRVATVEGDTVTVELVDENAAKPGDSLRLVKARVPNVVQVPATALVKANGGDAVFVLADGAVHEKKVTVVDRTGNDVLVGSGLTNGDQVVTTGAEGLKDGQKASQ